MSLCTKISLALICLGCLVQLHTSHAQNSQQDYLNAHNVARAQVGVPNINGTAQSQPMLKTMPIQGLETAILCTQMGVMVRTLLKAVAHLQGQLQ